MVLFRILTNARVNTENQKKKKINKMGKSGGSGSRQKLDWLDQMVLKLDHLQTIFKHFPSCVIYHCSYNIIQ